MKTKTFLIIVGILVAFLAFGCSKKSDPEPVHKQSDYVGTYDLSISLRHVRFVIYADFTIGNGQIDGELSQVTIQMGANNVERVEVSNTTLNQDFIINNIHFVGSKVQGEVIYNGNSSIVTITKN